MTRMSEQAVTKLVVVDGIQLEIIAEQEGSGPWQLAVRNPLGIFSVWNERFPSAQEAISAGLEAIEKEGIAGLMDTEGFEYLLH